MTLTARLKIKTCGAALAAGLLLALPVAAWACTVQPRILQISPGAGTSGSNVLVEGQAVVGGQPTVLGGSSSSVKIIWNDLSGPVLATVQPDRWGNFSASVKLPQARPGVYTLLAASDQGALARTVFEVRSSAPGVGSPSETGVETAAADLWKGFGAGQSFGEPSASPAGRGGLAAGTGLLAAGGICSTIGLAAVVRRRLSRF